jgi:Flp pilus assembly protein TadB
MASVVRWYDKRIEKLRQLPKCHLLLFITVKFLAGVALGLLLAIWLPIWTWWIFLIVALVIAIPLYAKIFSK